MHLCFKRPHGQFLTGGIQSKLKTTSILNISGIWPRPRLFSQKHKNENKYLIHQHFYNQKSKTVYIPSSYNIKMYHIIKEKHGKTK